MPRLHRYRRSLSRSRNRVAVCVIAAILGVAASGPAASASSRPPAVHTMPRQGAPLPGGSLPLVDHGGPVLAHPSIYAIWWGRASAFPRDARDASTRFFGGVSGSGQLRIITQYLRGAGANVGAITHLVDPSSPPRTPSPTSLGAEVGRVTNHHPDPNGIYVVFTANMPSGLTYCGWHAGATVGSTRLAVIYAPNVADNPACNPGDRVHANDYTTGTQALINVVAHELFEAMTDADPATHPAWIDAGGAEIGDKCAWQFAAPVVLANGSRWQLQAEWSNASGRCEQG